MRAQGRSRRRVGCLATSALTLLLACGSDGTRPSIVLVTIDTLRADRLSAYGYPLATSPNLEWLAARGVRFELALAPSSSTAPTHASIFTGRLPSWHSIGAFNSQFALDDEWPTLAGTLRAAGYTTAAIVSNPLLGRSLGLARGFDHYDDDTHGTGRFAAKGRRAQRAVERALGWLEAGPSAPFFLWLHLQDTHGPYVPDPGASCPVAASPAVPARLLPVGRDASGFRSIPLYQVWDDARAVAQYAHRYDCELALLDAQLGRLIGRTAWDPRLREALVVVTADHGEAFGEDDFFFAHGHGIGLDQVRVPLIAAGPGLPAGRVVREPVGLAGLFAALLDAAGVARPPGVEAVSPLAVAAGSPPGPVYVESLNQVGVAADGVFARRDLRPAADRAYWQAGNPNSGGGHWEPLGAPRARRLPAAVTSAAPAEAEARRRALERLDRFAERVAAARDERRDRRRGLELTPLQEEALRELGYAR